MAQSTEKSFLYSHVATLFASLRAQRIECHVGLTGFLHEECQDSKENKNIATCNQQRFDLARKQDHSLESLKTQNPRRAINPFGLNTWRLLRFSQSQDLKDSNIFRCPFHEITKPGCCHIRLVHLNGFQTFLFMSHNDGRNDTYNLAWIKSENIRMFKVYQSFCLKNSSEC